MIGMSATTGRAISGQEHLEQSITTILLTPLGSRVMRRNFGSLIPDLIDYPMTGANKLRLYAATVDALARWEPRIRVTGIDLQVSINGKVQLTLDGIASGKELQASVTLKG